MYFHLYLGKVCCFFCCYCCCFMRIVPNITTLLLTRTRFCITRLCFNVWSQVLLFTCFAEVLWLRIVTLPFFLMHATPTSHCAFTKLSPWTIPSINCKENILLFHLHPFHFWYSVLLVRCCHSRYCSFLSQTSLPNNFVP